MEEWQEAPIATSPKPDYSPAFEQIGRLIQAIGPELYLALEQALKDPEYKKRWIEWVVRRRGTKWPD